MNDRIQARPVNGMAVICFIFCIGTSPMLLRGATVESQAKFLVTQEAPSFQPGSLLSSSLLTGSTVRDADGAKLAEIDQLMIDPAAGKIAYVILALEGSAEKVAVPWGYLSVAEGSTLNLTANRDQLAKAQRVDANFLKQAIGKEIVGAPPENAPTTATGEVQEKSERPSQSEQAEPSRIRVERVEREATQVETPSGVTPNADNRWEYDPRTVTVVQGPVVGTLTAPITGATNDVVAIIEDSGKGEVRLQLGPEWYLTRIGLDLDPGDRVVAKGSEIAGEMPIIVVSDLSVDQRLVQLRLKDGTPVWSDPR